MKTGTLPTVSNLATWRELVEVTDAETGELIDLVTDVDAISVTLRDPDNFSTALTASLGDGTVTVIDDGVLEFLFTAGQMDDLCPKTYEVGILVTIDEEVTQLLLGYVPIVRGL